MFESVLQQNQAVKKNQLKGLISDAVKKSLNSGSTSAGGLVTPDISKAITNAAVLQSPELGLVNPVQVSDTKDRFRKLTALPSPGSSMGAGATTPQRDSASVLVEPDLKIFRRKGKVEDFIKDGVVDYDVIAYEIENQSTALAYDLGYAIWHGNTLANQYEFNGVVTAAVTNRTQFGGGVPTNLTFLDNLYDQSARRIGNYHKKAWLMSSEMLSLTGRLVRDVTRTELHTKELDGGFTLFYYRGIPIVTSAMAGGAGAGVMQTVTPTATGAGGGITAATYYFRVSKVTWNGESGAYTEVSQVVVAQDNVILTWAADENAQKYRIYCSTGTGTTTLVREISGYTYDGNGSITGNVTSYTFASVDPNVATAEVAGMTADKPLIPVGSVNPETIMLWDLEEAQGSGRMTYSHKGGTMYDSLIAYKPVSSDDDFEQFLVKGYMNLRHALEATSAINREVRAS